MKFAIWLDGVILDVDTTDFLYSVYKSKESNYYEKIPLNLKVHEDWKPFFNELRDRVGEDNIFILSPYDAITTNKILEELNLKLKFIANDGKTKPSKEPFIKLFKQYEKLDPLELIIIGSSALDLLSARFYDSRIRVLCVKRYHDCSKYSPYLYSENLIELLNSMKRIKMI